ncbi:MAG: hypothetical protein JSW07_03090 [bacterium]|nr:MAG: hypothetical protein JSW07_03090 [bacterium]
MRCKQAEKLIIEVSQAKLDSDIKVELDAHVLNCQQCASFRENLQMIREGINKIKAPEPSKDLLERTGALCHSEIIGKSESFHPATIKTPKFVWVAFGALLILTIAWAVPVLKEVVKSQIITRQAILIITIIVQNLIMLLFSPVLLRRLKLKSYLTNFQF